MRVLLAPDKFKGSLTAAEVARRLAAGLQSAHPDWPVTQLPIADGGDGTVAAAVAAGYTLIPLTVSGPTGEPVRSGYARRGDHAVVELADSCGLLRLPQGVFAPMTAGTVGLGQAIGHAAGAGARSIVIGIGGSASTDGGAGLLQALGVRILEAHGAPIDGGAAGLLLAERLDLSGLDPGLAEVELILASDVDNPLLGPSGAATVYGPQKGADPTQVALLEQALAHWAQLVAGTVPGEFASRPGAGAAGGVGFAAMAVLGARARSGVETMLELIGFDAALQAADLVITGEGSLDAQSLQGKGPVGVAAAARAAGVPVLAVAGRVLLSSIELREAGFESSYSLLDLEPDPAVCMAQAGRLLEEVGRRIATQRS